jgi:hypothetical protein
MGRRTGFGRETLCDGHQNRSNGKRRSDAFSSEPPCRSCMQPIETKLLSRRYTASGRFIVFAKDGQRGLPRNVRRSILRRLNITGFCSRTAFSAHSTAESMSPRHLWKRETTMEAPSPMRIVSRSFTALLGSPVCSSTAASTPTPGAYQEPRTKAVFATASLFSSPQVCFCHRKFAFVTASLLLPPQPRTREPYVVHAQGLLGRATQASFTSGLIDMTFETVKTFELFSGGMQPPPA